MIQMVLSQAKLLEFSEILQFWLSSCIFWLMDNVPVSQLALICTLKGGKYNIEEANEWCGQLQFEQLFENYLLISPFQKQLI